ncbi:MAG: Fe-S cluster assembly protein SufD [Chlamydiales bacterium]|jgi:Fe-S cluster assembly protein SufD
MLLDQDTHKNGMFSSLQDQYAAKADEGPLKKVRAKAWDHFLELGLPDKKTEVFRYFPLHQLYASTFKVAEEAEVSAEEITQYIFPECREAVLVFVNGRFSETLSNTGALPEQVAVEPLSRAVKTYGGFLMNRWAKAMKEETDAFAVLNAAIHEGGVFVYVPPKTVLASPIQILNVISCSEKKVMMHPRLHLFCGSQSEVTLVQDTALLSGEDYWLNQVLDFSLEDAARVRYASVAGVAHDAWHFEAVRATLKRDSYLSTVCPTEGSRGVRQDYSVALTGENAEVCLNGAWLLDEKRQAHTNVLMDHRAPHCQSSQLFKGVLDGMSHSSFEGKVYVHSEAQKTDAYQMNNNLILSDKARAESKPNLEIYADDVKASHGSTVGQLDKEHLHYLRTRGLTERDAKNLLLAGFCKQVIDRLPLESMRKTMAGRINRYLKG